MFQEISCKADEVAMIFELGARDCEETLQFAATFPSAQVYAFECNPATLPICRERVREYSGIHLVEKAVSETDGSLTFFPIDQEKTVTTWEDGNPGASSLYKASGKYPIENYVQNEIVVQSTRLETFMAENGIDAIDIIWMDIQGAELQALKSLGHYVKGVKLFHLEVEFFEIYEGQPLFAEVASFLISKGFVLIGFTYKSAYAGDAIFASSHCFSRANLAKMVLLTRSQLREFNSLFDTSMRVAKIFLDRKIT
jgi:FkbM family methyltransferase